MLISEVISLAQEAELKQLSVKDDPNAILGFINLGLLELYKRFPLRQSEAIITLQNAKSLYTLDGTDSDVSMEPGTELLVISLCYDEQGEELIINDEDNVLGINTPSYNTVEVPAVAQDEKLSIIYRASPNFVKYTTETLKLPPQLLEALLNYIGYRGHGSVKGDIKSENNTHYRRFVASCNTVKLEGLTTSDDLVSKSFTLRGFV